LPDVADVGHGAGAKVHHFTDHDAGAEAKPTLGSHHAADTSSAVLMALLSDLDTSTSVHHISNAEVQPGGTSPLAVIEALLSDREISPHPTSNVEHGADAEVHPPAFPTASPLAVFAALLSDSDPFPDLAPMTAEASHTLNLDPDEEHTAAAAFLALMDGSSSSDSSSSSLGAKDTAPDDSSSGYSSSQRAEQSSAGDSSSESSSSSPHRALLANDVLEALLSDDESMEPAPASINAPGTASSPARGPWTAADFESFGDLARYL
jgi:hypothetical protein